MTNSIHTPHGNLACQCRATYHIDWFTYADNRAAGLVGLEEVVAKAYGTQIEMEVDNDSTLSLNVQKRELAEGESLVLDRIKAHGWIEKHQLLLILTDLCNRDILPPGNYVVRVSW